jgi:hypothetical protein
MGQPTDVRVAVAGTTRRSLGVVVSPSSQRVSAFDDILLLAHADGVSLDDTEIYVKR